VKVRFLADANLNEHILSGILRQVPEIDFKTAHEANLHGLPDAKVLAIAAREGRVLVTQDRRTMPADFGEFIETNNSPGVLIIPQKRATRRAIDALILVWEASDAEEYVNSIRDLLT
jgi:predicted nuclease of predicted toxin-antitoxin system